MPPAWAGALYPSPSTTVYTPHQSTPEPDMKACRSIVAAGLLLLPSAAFANDSSVELSVGGLTFTRSSAVALESEDLSISLKQVVVKYRFVNRSNAPVTLTIGFPLPNIDLSESDINYALPAGGHEDFVGFHTEVDGKPVKFQVHQQAFLGDKDITADLKSAGLSPMPPPKAERLAALDPALRDRLVDAGILLRLDPDGKPHYQPGWSVRTTFVRQQTFAPGQPVAVTHRYRTSVGLSQDTVLRKGLRETIGLQQQVKTYTADYCLSPGFFKSVDALAGAEKANLNNVRERRIAYVLHTGAYWAGPIKSFRLTVDAGGPGRLIAFCGTGEVRLNGPAVEMTATDFVPKKDLKILILSKD
jgi:hypothetical protein